jgi:hypothetical protein
VTGISSPLLFHFGRRAAGTCTRDPVADPILGGVGLAAAKLLVWLALIMLVIWIIGFFARGAEGARWYRW